MDKDIFVQNVKSLCQRKGIKPTVACKESGAGKDLINRLETAGSIPSVLKVQLLANYLGVTTSQLLGETPSNDSSPQSTEPTLDEELMGVEFALFGEVKELTDAQKRDVLKFVKFLQQNKEEK